MSTQRDKLALAYNAALAKGDKVLDVSDLTADGGHFRTIKLPKGNTGTKRGVEGIAIVSDNYASYARAMELLGAEDFVPYATQFASLHGTEKITRAAAAPKLASPKRAKAPAILATAPTPSALGSYFVPRAMLASTETGAIVIRSPKATAAPLPSIQPRAPSVQLRVPSFVPSVPLPPKYTAPAPVPHYSPPKPQYSPPKAYSPPKPSSSVGFPNLPTVQMSPSKQSSSPSYKLPTVQMSPSRSSSRESSPIRLPTVQTSPSRQSSPIKLPTVQLSPSRQSSPIKLPTVQM
jgi:hypothetical protein